jgi:8-oxo-dGTP pyrophosphatase MutT (NUDIX family)
MIDTDPGPLIRDAATLIVVDRTADVPRVLMGRRRADQVFLPNKFVFPGGRVDDADALAPSVDELDPAEARLLALPRAGFAPYPAEAVRALALAALRETFEETGIAAGVHAASAGISNASRPPPWVPYLDNGVVPRLAGLRFFLRAITPRARPRRYDTRFFLMDAAEIAVRVATTDEELSEIGWYRLDTLEQMDVPSITRIVIGELRACLASGLQPADQRRVPFYFEQNDVMHRAELSLVPARP